MKKRIALTVETTEQVKNEFNNFCKSNRLTQKRVIEMLVKSFIDNPLAYKAAIVQYLGKEYLELLKD